MRAHFAVPVLITLAAALSGCGPVPVEVAERQCFDQLRPKAPLTGEAGMGVTSDGFRSKVKVEFNLGSTVTGDPSAAYNSCVKSRSGQMPSRPWWEIAGGRP